MAEPQASSAATDLLVDHPAWPGAALYSRRKLRFYDVMLAFNDRVFWRCPRSRLVELYDKCVSARHLDIGGSGSSVSLRLSVQAAVANVTELLLLGRREAVAMVDLGDPLAARALGQQAAKLAE